MVRRLGLVICVSSLLASPLLLACVEPGGAADAGATLDVATSDDADTSDDAGPPPDAYRGPDAGAPEDLQGAVDYWLEAGSLAGVAALAADADTRIVVTSGMATDTTPVDEHTLFNVASVSKTLTCGLALLLVEDGLLDRDAPLSEILPDVPIAHPAFPDVPITTRMLLSHTSGLVDDFLFLGDYTVTDGDPTVGMEQFTRDYVAVEAHWGAAQPGTRREYCNACIGIAGLVIERVSGRDFRALSEERLFGPLGLDGAAWFFADVDTSRLATPYAKSGSRYAALPQHNFAFYPASSLMISVAGLERWARVNLDDGMLDGTRYFATSSIDETRRAQFPDADRGQYLVWYAQSLGGKRWIGHSGSSYGTSAQIRYRPEEGRILIVLSNSDAYIRNRAGLTEGADAIDQILLRLDRELDVR